MKDTEYQPVHSHAGCHISAVMYLKIPEYLPSRNPTQNDDGAIGVLGHAARDPVWGPSSMTIHPEEGDFFIFTASQQHFVYPFRTEDGEGERRSVSFNAVFSSKTEQDELKKQQEEQNNV